MRRALACAILALVLAHPLTSGLGAAAPQAPDFPSAPAELGGAVANAGDEEKTDPGRLLEIQVELALMTDRSTFPYRIGAHAHGETIELRGFIPNEVVRQRALTIASEHSAWPVQDGLQIHPQTAWHCQAAPAIELERDARILLQKAFPEQGRSITVSAETPGKVIVSGTVSTYEEKVAVSHCLRKVRGCLAVNNQMLVLDPAVNAKPNCIPDTHTQPQPATHVEPQVPASLAATAKGPSRERGRKNCQPGLLRPEVKPMISPWISLQIKPAGTRGSGLNPPLTKTRPAPHAFAYANSCPALNESPGADKPATQFASTPSKSWNNEALRSSFFNLSLAPPRSAPAYLPISVVSAHHPETIMGGPDSTSTRLESPRSPTIFPCHQMSFDKARAAGPLPQRTLPESNPLRLTAFAELTTGPDPRARVAYCPWAAGREASKPVSPDLSAPFPSGFFKSCSGVSKQSAPAAPEKTSIPGPAKPTVLSYNTARAMSDARPSALVPPKWGPVNSAATPTRSASEATVPSLACASGWSDRLNPPGSNNAAAVAFSPVVPSSQANDWLTGTKVDALPPAAPPPVPAALHDQLKKCIDRACGNRVTAVEVIFRSSNKMLVRLKVHSLEEGSDLLQKIFQLPELEPYEVNLEVQVVP